MPAHRKPTNVLALAGAFAKNPSRGRARALEPQPLAFDVSTMPVPVTLTELEAIVWRNLARTITEGVVSEADVPTLIVTARLFARALYDETIDPKVTAQLRGYVALFGLSPADRSKVSVLPPGGAGRGDPDDEFFTS